MVWGKNAELDSDSDPVYDLVAVLNHKGNCRTAITLHLD